MHLVSTCCHVASALSTFLIFCSPHSLFFQKKEKREEEEKDSRREKQKERGVDGENISLDNGNR